MNSAVWLAVLSLLALPLAAQNPGQSPAAVFPTADLARQIDALIPQARAKGLSGATICDYGSYKMQLSVRATSGGAEVHAHWDDVMFVEKGTATLVTGGTVLGGQSKPGGETLGTKIEGGQSHALAPGDVYTVRAGTPHQLLLSPDTIFAVVVVKVHEP